jgi:hypothetical protein
VNKEYLLEKEWTTIDDKWYKHPMVKGVELSLDNALFAHKKMEENKKINSNIMRPTSFRFRVWDEQYKTFLKSYADTGLSFFVK